MIFRVPKQLGDGEVQFLRLTIPLTLINLSRFMIIGVFIAGFYVISVLQNHGISYSNHVHHFESDFKPCLYFKPICLFFCFQFERCTWFSIASQSDVAVDYNLLCHFLFLDMSEFLCAIMSSTSQQFYVHHVSSGFERSASS